FGGLEAIITGILDRIPGLRRRRELFVLFIIIYCFVGALATTTCGIFIANLVSYEFPPVTVLGATYVPPTWVIITAWLIVFSSVVFIPIMMIVQFLTAKGSCTDVSLSYNF
ncbi:Transporter, partial [Fasciolopsis buskii]